MDLRERKTRRSIREAFLELLATKPLERITVKELAARAEISKATFYLHYHSVFDLSEALQRELVDDVVTTGSTMGECARLLLEGGAAEVWGLTLAQARKK